MLELPTLPASKEGFISFFQNIQVETSMKDVISPSLAFPPIYLRNILDPQSITDMFDFIL